MADLLIVDDERITCLFLAKLAARLGHRSRAVHTAQDAVTSCRSANCDLVLLDLELPDKNGLSILPDLLQCPSSPEVIIITGTGDIKGAETAFKSGAWDFIPKPLSDDEVILSITRALQYREEKRNEKPPKLFSRESIIGQASNFKACLDLVARSAATDTNVLVTGETGSGKELIARAIHANSERAEGHFVVVDCASLPESLIASVLFGHEKGAFTGAETRRPGMIRQAEKGTLFLDEVGELPPTMQKAFLRVLQERRFRPLGGDAEVHTDFRLVAATHRDLDAMVNTGDFRRDLLHRLQGITVTVPPLRERRSDILNLLMHQLGQKSVSAEIAIKGVAPEFIQMLQAYDWPGNVRELFNAVDHAMAAVGDGPTLHPIHLPPQIRLPGLVPHLVDEKPIENNLPRPFHNHEQLPSIREYRDATIEVAEKSYLTELMRRTEGDIKTACKLSGLSESRLHALLKKYRTTRFRKSK